MLRVSLQQWLPPPQSPPFFIRETSANTSWGRMGTSAKRGLLGGRKIRREACLFLPFPSFPAHHLPPATVSSERLGTRQQQWCFRGARSHCFFCGYCTKKNHIKALLLQCFSFRFPRRSKSVTQSKIPIIFGVGINRKIQNIRVR